MITEELRKSLSEYLAENYVKSTESHPDYAPDIDIIKDAGVVFSKKESFSLEQLMEEVGKDGKMYSPENISISDINDDFPYERRNPILKQLRFGSGLKKRENALIELKKMAEREGMRLISEDEYQEYISLKKKNSFV